MIAIFSQRRHGGSSGVEIRCSYISQRICRCCRRKTGKFANKRFLVVILAATVCVRGRTNYSKTVVCGDCLRGLECKWQTWVNEITSTVVVFCRRLVSNSDNTTSIERDFLQKIRNSAVAEIYPVSSCV